MTRKPWLGPPAPRTPTVNAELRARGLIPLKWDGTRARLEAVGIACEPHADAITSTGGGQVTNLWGPRWAVLVAECDPCNEDAREWALAHATSDDDFRRSLETIAMLADVAHAREKIADYVQECWPGPAED